MVGEFIFPNIGVYTKVSLTLDFTVLPLCYDCLLAVSTEISTFCIRMP